MQSSSADEVSASSSSLSATNEYASLPELTASKIILIKSSDHLPKKSNLKTKSKLFSEEESTDKEKGKSKSVRWREGFELEDVLLIPPREEIRDEFTVEFLNGDKEDTLPGESSSLDLSVLKRVNSDVDFKYGDETLDGDDRSMPLKTSDITESTAIDNRSVLEQITTGPVAFEDGPPENFDSENRNNGAFQGKSKNPESGVASNKLGSQEALLIPTEDLATPKIQATNNEKYEIGDAVKTVDGEPIVKIIKASTKRPFTKPTLRYEVLPFEDSSEPPSRLESQQSCCSTDPETNSYKTKSKYTTGKLSVLFTEDTDYNFLCLNELYREVSKSLKSGTKVPLSDKAIGSMIDNLQSDYNTAVIDAPYCFNPHNNADWMEMGLNLSKLKYKKKKKGSKVFPLHDLNFKEFIMPGDTIGPLDNYMLVNENYLMSMENSVLDAMFPSDVSQINLIPKTTRPNENLKTITGNPFRFPKLIAPQYVPHPEVARRRETNVHVIMPKKTHTPPSSPLPEEKLVLKRPVNIQTIYTKPNIEVFPKAAFESESSESITKPHRLMLTKCRAKTQLNIISTDITSSDVTDDTLSKNTYTKDGEIIPVIKYQPRPGDYMTFIKSGHLTPTSELVTKQTKMSLFKQILTEEDIAGNTNILTDPKANTGLMYKESPSLYTELQEHSNIIVLTRDDVMELIDGEPEVPKYYTSSLSPGLYVPCPVKKAKTPPFSKAISQCKRRTVLTLHDFNELRTRQ